MDADHRAVLVEIGEQIAFLSRDDRLVRAVKGIRKYENFADMLANEDFRKIVPDLSKEQVEQLLSEIYPPNREKLGVVVLEVV